MNIGVVLTMLREQLPLMALPIWSKLNDVTFLQSSVGDLGAKGSGLVTERRISSRGDKVDDHTLLIVPHNLILSREAIEEHCKEDQDFRQLIEVAGGKSLRIDTLLFLLMQITITSTQHGQNVGLSTPWSEYVKMLPNEVPVPTRWTEEERSMLTGTSLETALDAKLASLVREFDALREDTANLPWCQKSWWEKEILEIGDWLLVDSWYRSRSLELPSAGESMIPCIDMVNHSSEPNAYYEPTPNDGVSLILRPEMELEHGTEITISYGTCKSAAEMLFSYGFIDDASVTKGLVLTLEPLPGDPLSKAKTRVFRGPPVVRLSGRDSGVVWESPFLYLLCLNEEDGLDFRILQQTDGAHSQLRVFWQDVDVTDSTDTIGSLIKDHPLEDVFELRAVALLQDRLSHQLERLLESDEALNTLGSDSVDVLDRRRNAQFLRAHETALLEQALSVVELQKNKLLESEAVLRYLGSMNDEVKSEKAAADTGSDEDFS